MFCPSQIVLSVGCVVIAGAVKIVNVWLLELEPQLLVVVSVKVYTPCATAAGKLKFNDVWLLMITLLLFLKTQA